MIHLNYTPEYAAFLDGLFTLLAVLAGVVCSLWKALRKGRQFSEYVFVLAIFVSFMIFGGKLVVINPEQLVDITGLNRMALPQGKSAIGIVIGGIVGLIVGSFLLKRNLSIIDDFAIAIPVGLAVRRVGCFLDGCCIGIPTDHFWGVLYPLNQLNGTALHPVQLYESLLCIAYAIILVYKGGHFRAPGNRLLVSATLYFPVRFITEFFRNSHIRFYSIDSIQVVLLLITFGLILLVFLRESTFANIHQNNHRQMQNTGLIGMISLSILLFLTLVIRQWYAPDEIRIMILFVWFPGFILLLYQVKKCLLPYLQPFAALFIFIIPILLSQKPGHPKTAKGYGSVELLGFTGNLMRDVTFGAEQTYMSGGCGAPGYYVYTKAPQTVTIKEKYSTGGLGIRYKSFTRKKRFMESSFHVLYGKNNESTEDGQYNKTSILYGFNPAFNYSTPEFGIGLGMTIGVTNYNQLDPNVDMEFEKEPYYKFQQVSPQFNIRIGSENIFCVEYHLNGYNHGIGELTNTIGLGSRFDSKSGFMIRSGIALYSSDKNTTGVFINGEFPIQNNQCYGAVFISNIFGVGLKQAGVNLKWILTKDAVYLP